MNQFTSIDAYIKSFHTDVQSLLQQIRATVKEAAPEAEEAFKYGLPTFVLHKNLVHFGAFKNHIGFYPTAAGIAAFEKELSVYKSSKGAVQFPIDKPLPLTLIKQITAYRVKQVTENKLIKK